MGVFLTPPWLNQNEFLFLDSPLSDFTGKEAINLPDFLLQLYFVRNLGDLLEELVCMRQTQEDITL